MKIFEKPEKKCLANEKELKWIVIFFYSNAYFK